MAKWRDLVRYIKVDTTYRVIQEEPDEIQILYTFGDYDEGEGRTQVMILAHDVLDQKEDWVQIVTPFARVDQVDLKTVLEEIGLTQVVGGAAIVGEYIVLRHSLPLSNLDTNEFEEPLELVAGAADLLEERFVGGDAY